MRIKINNIFRNIHINKQQGNEKRRRNFNNSKENDEDVIEKLDIVKDNIEFKRRGAIGQRSKQKFNVLDIFKSKFAINRNYYVLFVFMSILAVVSVYTNFATNRKLNEESYAVFGNNDNNDLSEEVESSISEELQDATSNNIDTRKKQEVQTVSVNKNTNTTQATTVKKASIIPLSFTKPIEGEIIKGYSVDKLLYSITLESWKTHDGVDIKAEIGKNVKSVEKGIVEKVYDDSFLGTTIIIDHGQGYKSVYSNLDTDVSVKEKQNITKSKVIGKVGKTSIGEIKDESHIHFMLMLNNKVVDPTSKIKF